MIRREKAIRLLSGLMFKGESKEALDMAIKALEQDPYDDCVSRQAVIDINERHHGQMPNHVNHEIWKEIKALPSVSPQQKMGRWIDVDGIWFKCSECDAHRKMMPAYKEYYCPNCGCRMQEVKG